MKVGLLDSGLGGLTILKPVQAVLPDAELLYFADSAYAPYGSRGTDFVVQRVDRICHFLAEHEVDAIVFACNTATVIAIDQIRAHCKLPIIGVEPAVKPAVQCSNRRKVAVLSTPATASSDRLRGLIQSWADGSEVCVLSSDTLAGAIESLPASSAEQIVDSEVERLSSLVEESGMDALVLACTHYPLVSNRFYHHLGEAVVVIEPGEAVARQLVRKLSETTANTNGVAGIRLFTSGDERAAEGLHRWASELMPDAHILSVEHKVLEVVTPLT